MCVFGGIITVSKFCANIAAAKNATARKVSLPTLTRSCFTGVGMTKRCQPNRMLRTIFHVQFGDARDDVLRLFSGIGMPSEPFPRSNLMHHRRGRGRALSAIDRKCTSPMHRFVIFRPDFSAFQFIGCNNWIHAPRLDSDSKRINSPNALSAFGARHKLSLQRLGEQFGHVFWPEIR